MGDAPTPVVPADAPAECRRVGHFCDLCGYEPCHLSHLPLSPEEGAKRRRPMEDPGDGHWVDVEPTEGVTASGDAVTIWRSHNPRSGGNFPPLAADQWCWVRGNMFEEPRGPVLAGEVYWGDRDDCDNPVRWYRVCETKLVKNSPPHALGGDEAKRSEQKDHPTPVGGLEPVAWRFKFAASPSWSYRDERPGADWADQCREVEPLYSSSTVSTQQAEIERLRESDRLLNALRDNSWDLLCFDVATGGDDYDIGWRVVGHWQAEPKERVLAEVFNDDPADAIRQALGKHHD